jgi:Phosphotransferase enzyme family
VAVDQPADQIQRVRNVVASGAAGIALDADRLTIEPVLNRGGFVNQSFRLSDGRATYRLKLASEPDAITELERWRHFEALLASRYRAPRMVGWVRLDDAGAGPLFEWIDGVTPERLEDVPVDSVARLLADLHSNAGLRESLARLGDPISSCADAYRATYQRRYMADLEFIAASPPPFLQPETLAWMREEALRMDSRIERAASFAETADSPVHGDLWLDNLLIDRAGKLWVLDWDGLSLGDPVVDWAMLSGPSRGHVDGASDAAPIAMPQTPATRGRFALYARAALLDWIIDPLADWVQAAHEPFFGKQIRSANEQVHDQALAAYRRRYG